MSEMSKWINFLKSFSWSQYTLAYRFPEDFFLHRWQTTTRIDGHYVAYRMGFLLVISLQIHVLSRYTANTYMYLPFIYFTHWTFLSMGVYALVHFVVVVICYTYQQVQEYAPSGSNGASDILELRCLNQCTLAMTNISHNFALGVTLCFWSAFWTQDVKVLTWATKMYHLILALLVFANYSTMSIPMVLSLAYLPFALALVYLLFMLSYFFAGGVDVNGRRYIYTLIDWEASPWIATMVVMASLTVILLAHILYYWLDQLKMWIFKRYLVGEERESNARRIPE